jgi:hypothetical protein
MSSEKQKNDEALTPIPVTHDTSVLRETKGFWSGNTVVFNPTDHIVVLEPVLTVAGLQRVINDYLREHAAPDIAEWIQKQCDNRRMDLCSLLQLRKTNPLRAYFAFRRVRAFDQPEYVWAADYLARSYPDEARRVEGLASALGEALRDDPKVISSIRTMALPSRWPIGGCWKHWRPGINAICPRRRWAGWAFRRGLLVLLCQTKILASDHVGKYNVMC